MIVGDRKIPKAPKIGDLRHTVSLVKRSRTPDAETGFNLEVDPYASVFARIERGRGNYQTTGSSHGEANATVPIQHILTIREDPDIVIQNRDWAVFDGRFFRIVQTQVLDQAAGYLMLYVTDDGPVSGYVFDNTQTEENPNDPDAPAAEPAPLDPRNPFWTAGVDG